MRNSPPQPGNYLGDDPDLTAELGHRLAATAQTGQGLITNYLFYGQRRAGQQQLTDQQDRNGEQWQERSADPARAGHRHPVAQAAQSTRDLLDRAPHGHEDPPETRVTDSQAQTARKTFRIVDPHQSRSGAEAEQQDPTNPGNQPPIDDNLTVDALAEDPNQRDPLTDPPAAVVPGPVTLATQGPEPGR